jgi:hypothetical protein
MTRYIIGPFLLMVIFFTSVFYAEAKDIGDIENWKKECVGRYQLSVPEDIEVAMNKPSYDGFTDNARFTDGQKALFSQMRYFGYLDVIAPAKESDVINLKNILSNNREKAKRELLNSNAEQEKNLGKLMGPITEFSPSLFGWDGENYMPGLYYFIDNKIYAHSLTNYEDESLRSINKKHFSAFLNGFRPRALYELPKQPGVCIPYGFIADDGNAPRDIGVTMRLVDHPDVEIFFRDSSYQLSPGEHYDADKEITFFLDQYSRKQKYIDRGFFGAHSVKIDGQKGRGNFFSIARADGSMDFGYIASVKGDFSATKDTPAQMLYVIRTAARAKGEPVSTDELKDMAEKILASIKRHPVQ